ncbi:hypothetical protein [Sphingomonas aerolata]|uniref:hypothetical protein n=1 Tax=Sphingomonas aerolata TaxID=185951 RepID=UPI002FDF5D6E
MKKDLLLRLGVKVPNEGARRFAHWIQHQPVGALSKLLRRTGIGRISMERMMSGDIVPDAPLAYQIFAATRCAVPINDWDAKPEGGWFDRVAPRESERRAA